MSLGSPPPSSGGDALLDAEAQSAAVPPRAAGLPRAPPLLVSSAKFTPSAADAPFGPPRGWCGRGWCGACPCEHMARQLGLQAADRADALRVYVRLASGCLGVAAFAFLLLALAFARWLDYAGGLALLGLACGSTALTAAAGLYASKRASFASLASAASSQRAAPAPAPAPLHPLALRLAKWSCVNPMPLLGLFMAVFLFAAMLGWLDFDTRLDPTNRRQLFSILLLGANSFLGMAAQLFLFLSASAMQRAGVDDSDDAEWEHHMLQDSDASDFHAPRIDQASSLQ